MWQVPIFSWHSPFRVIYLTMVWRILMTILVISCWECSLQGLGDSFIDRSLHGLFQNLSVNSIQNLPDCLSILNSCGSGKYSFLLLVTLSRVTPLSSFITYRMTYLATISKRFIVIRGQSRNEKQVMLCDNFDCGQCVGFLSNGMRPSGLNYQ